MITPKAFRCNCLHLPGLDELSSQLPEVTHLSSTIRYVLSACTWLCFVHVPCVFCLPPLHPQCLHCILNLHSGCWQPSLAASSGNHGLAPCSGCHILAPCAISGRGISVSWTSWRAPVCTPASAHWTLTGDVVFYLATTWGDSSQHQETLIHFYSDKRFLF